MKYRCISASLLFLAITAIATRDTYGQSQENLPHEVEPFLQQAHVPYTRAQGHLLNDARNVQFHPNGTLSVDILDGRATYQGGEWSIDHGSTEPNATQVDAGLSDQWPDLARFVDDPSRIRQIAESQQEVAVAAETGLFLSDGRQWRMELPRDGARRWAPLDVRGVVYDRKNRLWFACPQGVGCRDSTGQWTLYTAHDGLPFNDFTCLAAGSSGVWFGTTNGLLRRHEHQWEFRHGRRWLLDNHVRSIAVDNHGNAWIATAGGVSCIEFHEMTLGQKADLFREQIEAHHRRTPYGYVNPAVLKAPGEKSTATPQWSDNEGHYMGLYLAAMGLGYAARGDLQLRDDAHRAFEALAFLSEVTQGGTHPAPSGFIARTILPTQGPDPNLEFGPEYNRRRIERDALWKPIVPRWPIDESGKWYWKCDSSSDELDGHYLGYGVYYDRVCQTEAERDRVRGVVRRVTDHLLENNLRQVDHDGLPTRWGHFAPRDLNQNPQWWEERGLNSLSILTYLTVAHHITGDAKYRKVARELAVEQGYAMNGMTQPKHIAGVGSFGQSDDRMAFMNYYHLLRYETDPKLLGMYRFAAYRHWQVEKYERNPLFNFIYAACNQGRDYVDHWGVHHLSPDGDWLQSSVDTLKRYPLDLVDWPMSNAHRLDVSLLPSHVREPGRRNGLGGGLDRRPFRIDEQYLASWGHDPWQLKSGGSGRTLNPPTPYLLAYYLGLAHGFLTE